MDRARASNAANDGKQREGAKSAPRRATRSATPIAVPGELRSAIPQGGQPLPDDLRTDMETRFGQDFGDVVIHDGPDAEVLASQEHAKAYALGNHIVFGADRFSPATTDGQGLIAHELAHVVQQRRGGPPADACSSTLEAHADSAANAAVPGAQGVAVAGSAGVGIQCARREDERFKSRRREKNRKKEDRRNAPYDDANTEEAREEVVARDEERQRGVRNREDREYRGNFNRAAAEETEGQLRRLEAKYAGPGAANASNVERFRDLQQFIRLLRQQPNVGRRTQLSKNKRQGAFDELQRTPRHTYGDPQDKYAAGHRSLGVLDLPTGKSAYAQPDYSLLVTRAGRRPEILHVNLKSDQLDRMDVDSLMDRAEEYADQAQRNVLNSGGRYYLRFAFTPEPEYQVAMLRYLFREGTAIARVDFGFSPDTVYWFEDYKDSKAPERLAHAPQERLFGRSIRALEGREARADARADARAAGTQAREDQRGRERLERDDARLEARRDRQGAAATEKAEKNEEKEDEKLVRKEKKAAEKRQKADAAALAKERARLGREETERLAEHRRKGAAPLMAETTAPPATETSASHATGVRPATPKKKGSRTRKAGAATGTSSTPPAPTSDPADEMSASTPKTRRGRRAAAASEGQKEEVAEPSSPTAAARDDAQAKAKEKQQKAELAQRATLAKQRDPNSMGKLTAEPMASLSKEPMPETKPGKATNSTNVASPNKDKKGKKNAKSDKDAKGKSDTQPEKPSKSGKAPPKQQAKPAQASQPPKAAPAPQAKPVPPPQPQKAPSAPHRSPIPSAGADQTPTAAAPPVAAPARTRLPGSAPASVASGAQSPEAAGPGQPDTPERTPLPDAEHDTATRRRGVTTQSRGFLGGMVNVDIDEDYADSSKPYLVRTSITLSARASSAATAGSGNSGSAQAGGSGSFSIAYTTRMSLAEKDAFLQSVAAGRGGTHPAMPLVELIHRRKFDEATALMQAQLGGGDPREAFARRAEGDVMETSAEGQVFGGIGAGSRSASGGIGARGAVSAGAGIRRYSAVTRGKDVITVVLQKSSGSEGAGSFNLGIAGMEVTNQSDSKNEQEVSFTLDPNSPDYAAQRAEILGATSLEQLNAIAGRQPSLLSGRGARSQQSDMNSVEATLAGFGIAIDQGGSFSEGEGVDAEGRKTRDVAGGSTLGGALVAFDRRINPVSQTDTFSGTTFADNTAEAVTQAETRSINYQRSFDTLASSAMQAPVATLLGVLSGSQSPLLEDVDASGVMLSDESHAHIAEVARNRSLWHASWSMKGVSRGSIEEWEATRQAVLAANGDRHLIQRALAEWEAGDSGRSEDVEMLAGDTGAAFDLPESLRDQRTAFQSLIFRNPMDRAFQMLEQDQYDAALQELDAIDARIGELSSAIQTGVSEVGDAAKFAEMQRLIAERRGQVQALTLQVQSAKRHEGNEEFTGPRQESAQTDEQMLLQQDVAAQRALESDQIQQVIKAALSNHQKESELFKAIEDSLDSWFSANYTSYIAEQFTALQRMYEPWESQTRELRRLYEAQGESPDRARPYGPNWEKYRQLLDRFAKG